MEVSGHDQAQGWPDTLMSTHHILAAAVSGFEHLFFALIYVAIIMH